jgi:hypothetical protein
MARPFFERDDVDDALFELADADDLTAIVGAGASAEAGLPTWPELVTSLLGDVARRVGVPQELSPRRQRQWLEDFCTSITSIYGLPGAGAIAKAWLGDEFIERVTHHLYEAVQDPRPGRFAQGVARLQVAFEEDCEIATTNYDTLLEQALRQEGVRDVRSYVVNREIAAGNVVRHLHGLITPRESRGRIVLAESDYYQMQAPRIWQEQYAQGKLRSTTCLFVGTSLSDPNLLRYLYRTAGTRQHFALFTRQADSPRGDVSDLVADSRDRAVLRRWREMNVTPVIADYYVQSAQFLHEVARLRELGDEYEPYVDRLDRWEDEIYGSLLQTRNVTRFRRTQDALHEQLTQWLDAVRRYTRFRRLGQRRELLGLHLWVRRPRRRGLILGASSDRVWRTPGAIQDLRIRLPTIWVAVETFCRGRPMVQNVDRELASRWRNVVGIPVFLEAEPWGNLPVGVLTLASDLPAPWSSLSRLGASLFDLVAPYLATNARDLLTPE